MGGIRFVHFMERTTVRVLQGSEAIHVPKEVKKGSFIAIAIDFSMNFSLGSVRMTCLELLSFWFEKRVMLRLITISILLSF